MIDNVRVLFRQVVGGRFWCALAAVLIAVGCGGGGGGGNSEPMPSAGGTFTFFNTTAATDSDDDYAFDLDTDGNGMWIAMWSYRFVGCCVERDAEIMLARSFDNGLTWSDPELLDPNAASEDFEDWQGTIATDGAGNWIAVWESIDWLPTDSLVTLVSRSTDNGATWSPSTRLNPAVTGPYFEDGFRKVETDRLGEWFIGWGLHNNLPPNDYTEMMKFSNDAGSTWSDLAASPVDDSAYSMVFDLAGTGIIAWWDGTSLAVVRSASNSSVWSAPVLIPAGQPGEPTPNVATDGLGNWIIGYSIRDVEYDTDIFVVRSSDNGLTWSDPIPVNSNAQSDFETLQKYVRDWGVQIATNGLGRWIAVWEYSSVEPNVPLQFAEGDLAVAESLDNGRTWSPQMRLSDDTLDDGIHDTIPTLVSRGGDEWLLVWERELILGAAVPPTGPDIDLVYSTDFADGLPSAN